MPWESMRVVFLGVRRPDTPRIAAGQLSKDEDIVLELELLGPKRFIDVKGAECLHCWSYTCTGHNAACC